MHEGSPCAAPLTLARGGVHIGRVVATGGGSAAVGAAAGVHARHDAAKLWVWRHHFLWLVSCIVCVAAPASVVGATVRVPPAAVVRACGHSPSSGAYATHSHALTHALTHTYTRPHTHAPRRYPSLFHDVEAASEQVASITDVHTAPPWKYDVARVMHAGVGGVDMAVVAVPDPSDASKTTLFAGPVPPPPNTHMHAHSHARSHAHSHAHSTPLHASDCVLCRSMRPPRTCTTTTWCVCVHASCGRCSPTTTSPRGERSA